MAARDLLAASAPRSDRMLLETTGLHTASEYQIKIFRHIEAAIAAKQAGGEIENAVAAAVAGSGKTTTIVAAAKLFPKAWKVIFVAFNKDIVDELEKRLPQNIWAKTLNGLGWGVLRKFIMGENGGVAPKMDKYKVNGIIRRMRSTDRVFDLLCKDHYSSIKLLVSQAKANGIVPAELEGRGWVSAEGMEDTDDSVWADILLHHQKYVSPDVRPSVIAAARRVLTASLRDEESFDFDDQKYVSVVRRTESGNPLPCFKYDGIMIDEVQDVSRIDRLLLEMHKKPEDCRFGTPGTVVMGVGDPRQAIYGFRGADVNSIEEFKRAFNAIELPLSISYRCSKAIVEHARAIYPVIEAAPNAPEGEVATLDQFDINMLKSSDMVICRNNAPTVQLAYALIRARIPVFVKGRDIGRDLMSLIENMKAESVRDLAIKLGLWEEQQCAIIREANPDDEDSIQRIEDRADTVRVFIRENADDNVETLLSDISGMFGAEGYDKNDDRDMRGKVVISSMHKSKGLEADRVFILDHHLMYGRWIKEDTWQWTQEMNLDYVATTRAMTSLFYITLKGILQGEATV